LLQGPVALTAQHLLPGKFGISFAGRGGISVGIVRLRTNSLGACFVLFVDFSVSSIVF
jgi:hypothetical protein